jgi:hypothetical protein
MKRMIPLWTLMMVLLLACSSCGVGEHENPPDMIPTAGGEQQETYTNAAFGVELLYPATWTATEAADQSSVAFVSADTRPTRATFSFERLDPPPASLVEYVAEQHPDWTLITFNTPTLQGYFFDDPVAGPNGGDVREYVFQKGEIFVQVHVEFFEEGKAAFLAVLDSMTIQ